MDKCKFCGKELDPRNMSTEWIQNPYSSDFCNPECYEAYKKEKVENDIDKLMLAVGIPKKLVNISSKESPKKSSSKLILLSPSLILNILFLNFTLHFDYHFLLNF